MPEIDNEAEYRAGYLEGFRCARVEDVADPEIDPAPDIPNEKKAHHVGWHDGRSHGLDASKP